MFDISILDGSAGRLSLAANPFAHPDDVLSACFGGEHTEDTSATANIKDSLPLEELLVLEDGVAVGTGPDRVLEHFLVDAYRNDGVSHIYSGFLHVFEGLPKWA